MSKLDWNVLFKPIVLKKNKKDDEQIKKTGIEIKEAPKLDENKKIYFILTNALINFLVVIGTAGSFVKPFDIKCYMPVIWVVSLIIATFMAFLYYNMLTKTLGYFISLVAFLYGIFNLKYMIKGGFGYISNKLMAFFEKELDLPVERSYNVYGYNEEISVTVCMIFIIFAVMLLFNMVISEIKGFVFIFLATFPVMQMGMYFNQKADMLYFTIYIAGLLGLFFLRNSRHYHMEYKKKKGYKQINRKNKVVYDYTNDGKNSLSFVLVLTVLIIGITLVGGVAFPQKEYHANSDYDTWREDTKDFTKQLIMVGFWGMISPNGGSAGGVGRNRLGQSKYVRLDYETDLILRMPVYEDEESTYLKSFIGTFYRDEYWEMISENKDNKIKLEDYGLTSDDIVELQSEIISKCNLYSGYNAFVKRTKDMEVINVAASPQFMYVPYNDFTLNLYDKVINDDEYIGRHRINRRMIIRSFPFVNNINIDKFRNYIKDYMDNIKSNISAITENGGELSTEESEQDNIIKTEEKYSKYVYDMYMDVPDENEKVIAEFCEKYGLNKDSENITERLKEIFQTDYTYTLMPGVTPKDKEFVNYFLTKQKKGYCTYFATSATLIFRYLGIPARYVEGYLTTSLTAGNGPNEIMDDTAHAWAEIYIDGAGWVPIEVTPGFVNEEDMADDRQQTNPPVAQDEIDSMEPTTEQQLQDDLQQPTTAPDPGLYVPPTQEPETQPQEEPETEPHTDSQNKENQNQTLPQPSEDAGEDLLQKILPWLAPLLILLAAAALIVLLIRARCAHILSERAKKYRGSPETAVRAALAQTEKVSEEEGLLLDEYTDPEKALQKYTFLTEDLVAWYQSLSLEAAFSTHTFDEQTKSDAVRFVQSFTKSIYQGRSRFGQFVMKWISCDL